MWYRILWFLGIIALTVDALTMTALQNPAFHHPELNTLYDRVAISPERPRELKHAQLVEMLHRLQQRRPDLLRLEKAGRSVEGRDIYLVTVGQGPRTVLMWSQMHGNEPTATAALLDIFNFLVSEPEHPLAQTILQGCTLYAIPMLNPDGAERFQRRNAQDIDINRDARDLATPEGRLLKAVRDRLQPEFGFNLHDQNARRTVGNTNKLVAIALLVPPFDEFESDNPQRVEAKKVASVIYQALSPYIYGHIARYDASFMPRAFGDTMQKWGTRTVLIESGGWYENRPRFLVKMNFIALLEAFHAIATGSFQDANPGLYDALPQNDKELFDLLIRDPWIVDDRHPEPYKSDLAVNFEDGDETDHGPPLARITDIGDLDIFAAKDTIEARGLAALPGRLALLSRAEARRLPDPAVLVGYLRRGVTTVLVPFAPAERDSLRQRLPELRKMALPVNIGFVVELPAVPDPVDAAATLELGEALSNLALAVVVSRQATGAPGEPPLLRWLRRPLVEKTALVDALRRSADPVQSLKTMAELATRLGLQNRGSLRLGAPADVVLYRLESREPLRLAETPHAVLVNGRVVFEQGELKPDVAAGRLLLPQ